MTGSRFLCPIFTALDQNADPLPRAQLYFYDNNTTNQMQIYTDIDLTTAQGQPVLADGAGRFLRDMFLSNGLYAVELRNASGVQQWLKNDCGASVSGSGTDASFPFPGAVVEFYGTQEQLDVAISDFWYVMDGTSGVPNLNNTYSKACVDVASIGLTGGANIPTGTVGDHELTVAEMPTHSHFEFNGDSSTTLLSSSNYPSKTRSAGNNSDYIIAGSATTADIGKTSDAGNGDGHAHTLTMDTYDPPFFNLIKLLYLGF